MIEVTDQELINQLETPELAEVTDEAILSELNTPDAPIQKTEIEDTFMKWMGRFSTGMRDPLLGAAQLIENALPSYQENFAGPVNRWLHDKTGGAVGYEDNINKSIQEREKQYQAELPTDEGFDEARMFGTLASEMLALRGLGAPKTVQGAIGQGAAIGSGAGMVAPVTDDDYWKQKNSDITTGALIGGAFGPIGHGISRIISPKAASNIDVEDLKKAGIDVTPGQASGGIGNLAEEKLTSAPFLGPKIAQSRETARNQFNSVVLNKVVEPIGGKVNSIGNSGIAQASKQIDKAYDDAKKVIPGIVLDKEANVSLTNLMKMAKNLPEDELRRFNRFFENNFSKKLSPAGGMTSETYKRLDSDLGKLVSNTGGKEVQGAFKEMQNILNQQARRISPEFSDKMKAADQAYAQLVRVENAANRSSVNDGVFTPGQLLQGIKSSDKSVRKNQFAKGEALLQDFAKKGQRVLGDKYPDSGTAGRGFMGALLGGGMFEPVTAASVGGGLGAASLMYSPKLMTNLITKRPEIAKEIANKVGIATPLLGASLMGQ